MKSQNLVKIVSACVGVVVALLFLVLVVSEPDQDVVAKSPLLGQPAPSVASTTIDGEPFALERRKGSWVVLNFFNSTCVPCINEHDLLVEFAASELANANAAELYTIINDDSSDAVRDFLRKTVERGQRSPMTTAQLPSLLVWREYQKRGSLIQMESFVCESLAN